MDRIKEILARPSEPSITASEADFAKILSNPLSLKEEIAISADVDATIQSIRNKLWSKGRIALLLRGSIEDNPCMELAKALAELHFETGHHLAALLSSHGSIVKKDAGAMEALTRLLDPSACQAYVDVQVPIIIKAKKRFIDSL